MPHFSHALESVKNKENTIFIHSKQLVIDMPHLPYIEMEFSYNFFCIYVGGKCGENEKKRKLFSYKSIKGL